ncbi:hypothetical protein E7T09_08575 [Deinococcus sp. KSM4-11]|uniref:hypothetical protein n=1 Tax=Deinococcus sp. KSM4-11 TaxID=2568654 RepID=UPI0010A4466A|nr:hypothetical protein [Deinococcus sp. KSM4-11]THF87199.1 hypothetical protein E7T09_08575 [Deinococcus sp. KSM4-11]
MPGTIDRVRFHHQGRTFTVYLKDVQRQDAHSLAALYLKGRVTLRVSRLHHADLRGRLSHSSSIGVQQQDIDRWQNEGGPAFEDLP